MKPQVINGLTYEMAQTQVQGSKYKALNKFKQFATASFTYEDMESEADIAIMKAWQGWNPAESKFNTYATNYMNWMLYRALDTYNDTFKRNVMVKNDLKARGETYATLSKKKITKDPEFNKLHGLDGKKEFTRELFNSYVYHTSAKTFGVNVIKTQGDFNQSDSDDTDFDILEFADPSAITANDPFENFEMEHDAVHLGKTEKVIYAMLKDGQDIGTIAKALKMSKQRLMKKFAGINLRATQGA